VFIVVYFVIDSVRKLLDILLYVKDQHTTEVSEEVVESGRSSCPIGNAAQFYVSGFEGRKQYDNRSALSGIDINIYSRYAELIIISGIEK
jgi:hypothetical protein